MGMFKLGDSTSTLVTRHGLAFARRRKRSRASRLGECLFSLYVDLEYGPSSLPASIIFYFSVTWFRRDQELSKQKCHPQ